MVRLFGLCSALLFASSVSAANIIDLGPSDYKRWGSGSFHHTSGGINSKFGQTVRMPPMNTNLTVTRNPVIPYRSIANGAKLFRNINPASAAASAALTALMLGLDWAFDDELDSWAKEGFDEYVDPSFGLWWHNSPNGQLFFPTAESGCRSLFSVHRPNGSYSHFTIAAGGTQALCYGNSSPGGPVNVQGTLGRTANNCPEGYEFSYVVGGCVMLGAPVPLTDADFDLLADALPSANPGDVGNAAADIMARTNAPLSGFHDTTIEGPASSTGPASTSTSTDPVTGDTIVTNTSTTTNYNYGDTTITTTNITTSTTYQNGQETSTTTTTDTPGELPVSSGGGAAGEWPGFCDWAAVVCEWLDWTREEPPPDVDLPKPIDDDFYEEKNISFGAKSCPDDHQINLAPFLPTAVAVSFQPLCDFAGIIYYMVMTASYIIAAYISIGVARNA